MTNEYIELATENVIWENIGGQVITANMSMGVYCNIESKSGIAIWYLLMSSMSIAELHTALQTYYLDLPSNYLQHVGAFIQKLVVANIWKISNKPIVPSEEIDRNIAEYDPSQCYEKPYVISYDDIDTLLQLDPIDDDISELINEG